MRCLNLSDQFDGKTDEQALLIQAKIKELATFAAKDGQPVYTIATGSIPEFEVDEGTQVQE